MIWGEGRGARRCGDGGTVESRRIQGDVPFGLGPVFRKGHGVHLDVEGKHAEARPAAVAPAADAPMLCKGPKQLQQGNGPEQ